MVNDIRSQPIRIATLDDITARPRYVATVPPRRSLFRFVLALYSFPRKIASCGVSDCFQNHKKGCLVQMADGSECSICANCAERFLDAAAMRPPKPARARAVRTSSAGSPRRERAPAAAVTTRQISHGEFTRECERIKEQVKTLKQASRGGNWLFQSLSQFQKASPAELLTSLQQLQRDPQAEAVFERLIERDASDQQLQDVEQLQGLAIFAEDIRELLIERILKPLTLLEEKAAKAGADGSVAVPLRWTEQVDSDLSAAEQLIAEGRSFFTESNLKRLRSVPLDDQAALQVRNLHWNCDKGMPERS